jgi:hypothetical protein
MKKIFPLIIAGLFVLLSAVCASAQPQNIGTLDTWTKAFSRAPVLSEVTHLRQVRATSQKTFDRVVFEFDGSIPNYNIKYLTSRIYEDLDGKHRIKIAGKVFLQLELFVIPYDERQDEFAKRKGFSPKGRLKMPSFREIDDKGTFEGFYDFLFGMSSRKVFRVSELSNPARLVIDLRH